MWPIDKTLTGTTNPSGPGSNRSEKGLHISQISRIGASPSEGYVQYTYWGLDLTPF